MTPGDHLDNAAVYLDMAENYARRDAPEHASAFALLAQGHAILAGELAAASAGDTLPVVHRCALPSDVPGGLPGVDLRCVECDALWTLTAVTSGHLVWTQQVTVRRQDIPAIIPTEGGAR